MQSIVLKRPRLSGLLIRLPVMVAVGFLLPPTIAVVVGALILLTTWTTPPTSSPLDIRDAAWLNTYLRDNLLHLKENITPAGEMVWWPTNTAPAGWLVCNGANVSRTQYPDLFAVLVKKSTATMTIASPGVVTWTGHTLSAGDPVKFTTTGALPTGITAGVTYYVKSPATNTFQLSATPGGSAINTSGSQSGTHTATFAPFGEGDGTTTFGLPDFRGRSSIGADDSHALGSTGGSETVTLIEDNLPEHSHSMPTHAHGIGYIGIMVEAGATETPALNLGGGGFTVETDGGNGGFTSNVGSGTAVNIRNPYLALVKLIKT